MAVLLINFCGADFPGEHLPSIWGFIDFFFTQPFKKNRLPNIWVTLKSTARL